MRTLTTLMLTLLAALLVILLEAPDLRAESASDRAAIHRKYQTSPDGRHGQSNPWQTEARYEHRRDLRNNRVAERLHWRDYHGYVDKHYQIQRRYGLYSEAAAYRFDHIYSYDLRSIRGDRRGGGSCDRRR